MVISRSFIWAMIYLGMIFSENRRPLFRIMP